MLSNMTHNEENGIHTFSLPWQGRTLTVQSGKYAEQANGNCTVQYGDTVIMGVSVMSKGSREGLNYFPLMVDYEEKLYAAGKIKGSRFIKREGRPSDDAVLSGRIIDRSLRPFFNQDIRREVQVVATTLSWDQENDPVIMSLLATTVALVISDIPWAGPVVGVRLSRLNDEWVINANYEQRDESILDLFVSVRDDMAVMIEADGDEVKDEIVAEGVELAIKEAQPVVAFLKAIQEKIGKEKQDIIADLPEDTKARHQEMRDIVEGIVGTRMAEALAVSDRAERSPLLDAINEELETKLKEDPEVTKEERDVAMGHLEKLRKKETKKLYLVDGKRLDGRGFEEVRKLNIDVGVLPRTHGTGVFQRGETQALTVLTLGSPSDEQILDSLEESDTKKRYMHHYNFPGFSVGEAKPNRFVSRREIGHGALAEKALERMIPSKEDFPYTIRLVSEILSSNGSSSMAATCGSTLALLDGGVPLKKPVAGIAMGILTDDDKPTEDYRILTDIQGAEDHYGEMDFKIAGTDKGITAIQLDVKNTGLTPKMALETIMQSRKARLEILDEMLRVIPTHREEMSTYAPRIYTLKIDPEKIGDVIGPKGKTINGIIDETGVQIDIEDEGLVMITSTDAPAAEKAKKMVNDITRDVVAGEIFPDSTVTRIMDFGAFVEFLPGREGLVHISELAPFHVGQVTDIVKLGDKIPVKLTEIDSEGRNNLSLKETDYEYPPEVMAKAKEAPAPRTPRPGGGGGFRGNNNRGPRRDNGGSRGPRRDNGPRR